MAKPKKDLVREERILNEVVVDAYGTDERNLSWYYYLENKMRFPFRARCIAAKLVSPLNRGEMIEIQRLAPEETCSGDILVLIRWQGRKLAVPLSQLVAVDADKLTAEAISDWHYWTAQGYQF